MPDLVTVADVSNYTGPISPDQAESLAAAGIEHVIVRISPESEDLAAITRQQLGVLRAAGLAVSGYLFPEYDAAPGESLARALGISGPLRTLWIDVEPPGLPSAVIIRSWIVRAAEASPVPVGVYTSGWVLAQLPGWEPITLPLWAAAYGERPDSLEVAFGGWMRAAGIQYSADVRVGGVLCDLSVFDARALE